MARRKTPASNGYVEPTPEAVISMQMKWERERHGVVMDGLDERAKQLVQTRARPRKP